MSKNKYKINSHNQLIDLNGDSINFELSFDIQSVNNNEQFEILVVDQNTLDNNENFTKTEEYKKSINGKMNGSVKSDNNKYQNFFIIIRSKNEQEVEITINKKDIEPNNEKIQFDEEEFQKNKEFNQLQNQIQNQEFQQIQQNQQFHNKNYNQNYNQNQQFNNQNQQFNNQNQLQNQQFNNQNQLQNQEFHNNQQFNNQNNQEFHNNKQFNNQNQLQNHDKEKNTELKNNKEEIKKNNINWKLYIFIFIICLILFGIYFYINKKTSNKSNIIVENN